MAVENYQTSYQFGVSEFTTNPWTFERDVEAYARLGVSAIEVCEFKLDPVRIDAQMKHLTDLGLTITSVQPSVRTLFPSLSQPEPLEPKARMALFRQSLQRLARYAPGVAFVTNTGVPPNGNMQQVWDEAISEYREVARFAADLGVRVALEPLNPAIMNIETAVWTLPQALEIVAAVDCDNFGICLDCWNIWQNADLAAAIAACGARIFVVQISDWRTPRSFQDRLIPGQGDIPLAEFLRHVRGAGFSGAYSVEIFSANVPDALWDSDLEQVIQASRAGLDRAWKASF